MRQKYLAGSKRPTSREEVAGLIGLDKQERFSRRPVRAVIEHLRHQLTGQGQAVTPAGQAVLIGSNRVLSEIPANLRARYAARQKNIPNLDELTEDLNSTMPEKITEPGTQSPRDLAEQCEKVSVLIAQHGATVANPELLSSRSTVIEITWKGFLESPHAQIQELLCNESEISYVNVIAQENRFSRSDVAITLKVARETISP